MFKRLGAFTGGWKKKAQSPLFAALGLILYAGLAPAAGFDCAKAVTLIEKMICANPELSQLDTDLARYYLIASGELEESKACLKNDQLRWLKSVRNVCNDNACLKTAYVNRLSELDGFQPGASAIRYIELPGAPTLVWIIPPLKGITPSKTSVPLELIGKPGWAEDGSDVYSLKTKSGNTYLLDFPGLRDIKRDRFPELTNERIARHENETPAFMIRGRGELRSHEAYFDPAHCVFFYRMP
ncbi:MAG: hypothetical protein H0X43_07570 [Nitrosospira sp.]|nr:hypothetical protein [Nitrosospira sp.]